MPLFSSHRNTRATPATAQPVTTSTHHRASNESHQSNRSGRGLFSSRRRSSSLSSSDIDSPSHRNHNTSGTNGLGSLFHRSSHEDPSLTAARQRVMAAEQAEREADRALSAARMSVREAREHVKALEREASEEAKAARIKQQGARDLGKRAKPLGRHGRY